MRRLISIVVLLFLFFRPTASAGLTAVQKQCRDQTQTLTHCPDVGCAPDHHSNLNRGKNRTDAAASPQSMTVADIVALEIKNDSHWSEDQERTPIDAVGEGRAGVVEAYL